MTITDGLLIVATLLSPLIAVQVQKVIERARERGTGQRRVFYALMATRATRVAPDHVQALNMIDLEFNGTRWRGPTSKEREVLNRWRIYADHLNDALDDANDAAVAVWLQRGDELFTDLLVALASALGYPFDRVQLRRGIYRPRAHGEAEVRQRAIERALADILTGASALPINITAVPVNEEAAELQKKLLDAYTEEGALKIKSVA